MAVELDISGLMSAAGIEQTGSVVVTDLMSGLEPEVKDDWMYIGLRAIRDVARRKAGKITSMGNIGCGNGIISIGSLQTIPELEKMTVTDVLDYILEQIRMNVESNVPPATLERCAISYVAGRDCEPLIEKVDLIYGNLPLIMVNGEELAEDRATTTLTDAKAYAHLNQGPEDQLRKYSLLSQLGFLLSAKEKLNPGGSIITLLGGRVPYEALDETFQRAGLEYREISCAFKRQSDPEFLQEYAQYEDAEGVDFLFYDYEKAAAILHQQGIAVPDIIEGCTGAALKEMLKDAALNAKKAHALAQTGKNVGHIAFAFEAWEPVDVTH